MPILCENLLQAILDPALVVQEDGVILAGNAAAWRFLGMVDGKQLIGYSLINCLPGPPDGGESLSGQVLHSLQQTLATGNQRAEWVRRRPDISPVTIEVSFSVMEGTSPRQVLVQWRDISERRQMEDALRRSEERYRLLAENAHDVIWVLGLDSRFIYVSPSVQKLRGYTPEEVLQQSMEEVLTPESLRLVQESMAFIVQDVQSGVRVDHELTEVEQPCKDGSTVWTEVKTTGLYDDAGRFIGLLGVTRDIRERRQRDEQLRQLNATLEQRVQERTAELEAANTRLAKALQHKDEFLATMSHELRTPLTGVLSFAQTLEEEIYGSLLPRQLQAVQLIRGAGEHLLSMINGILDLSRLQADQFRLHSGMASVDVLCRLSLRVLDKVNCDPPHCVSYSIDRPEAMIVADQQRIVQMLEHLLSNAAKFTPPGGRIELKVQTDPEAQRVTLSVSDTGIGIGASEQPRIFDPFVQLDSRLARRYQGVGIGLALVRAIAELHGGCVGIESEPGVGSRFWVTLPLATPMQVG